MKCYISILFGLFVIWTGLLRSIEAQAFKPNAFWFCLTMGAISIAAGYLFRISWTKSGTVVGVFAGIVVAAFYLNCLIVQPEKDATYRVGLAILAAITELAFILLPANQPANSK
ncbi:MAG: uncharacterized membrane protein HdeD (DUF308 family) [Mariniblastus sp.]